MLYHQVPPDSYENLRAEIAKRYTDSRDLRYLNDRWYWNLRNSYRIAHNARDWVYTSRLVTIASATLLPAFVSLASGHPNYGFSTISIILSVIVALGNGVLVVTKVQERWRLYRLLRDQLEFEGWRLSAVEPPTPAAFERFTRKVEQYLAEARSEYLHDIVSHPGQQPPIVEDPGESLGSKRPVDKPPQQSV